MDFITKVKEIMLRPGPMFQELDKKGMSEAFKYLLIIAVVGAIGSAAVTMFTVPDAIVFFGTLFGSYVGILIGIVIGGLILHIFAYIVGARQGLEKTLTMVMYAATPSILLGWIPYVGILFGLWAIVLYILGLKAVQKLSTGRAVIAVLLPIIILGILALIGLLVLLSFIPPELLPELFSSGISGTGTCTMDNPNFPFCA